MRKPTTDLAPSSVSRRKRCGTSMTSVRRAAREDDYAVETLGANHRAISLRSYKPLEGDAIEEPRQAFFAFPSMCVRLMNGRVRMTRRLELDKGARDLEVWELEDTGRWLY